MTLVERWACHLDGLFEFADPTYDLGSISKYDDHTSLPAPKSHSTYVHDDFTDQWS